MSAPDYKQTLDDHRALLILVKQVGCHLKPKAFNAIYVRISRIETINIHSKQRMIRLRYTKSYPPEKNEWGEFQAHRKVVGLICIGKCENSDEVGEVCRLYEDIDRAYGDTLYDSRLVLFGVDKDGGILDRELPTENGCGVKDQEKMSKVKVMHSRLKEKLSPLHSARENKDKKTEAGTNTSKRSVLFYPDEDQCPDLEEKLQDYVASLFWVVDSKRLDRSHERQEKPPLLMTPFEKKDPSGFDTDTRAYKKRCQARLRKYLGDLCLLAGLPGEALLHYQTSLDVLKSVNDWMWLGGAFEGICAASVAIAKPQTEPTSFPRNSSFSSFSVKRGVSTNKDHFRPGGLSQALNGLDLHSSQSRSNLAVDDVIDKMKEAIMNYSKFPGAGIIELEASLKACHIAIEHEKCIAAADFLQNIVYINLHLTDTEKIERYCVMSELYDKAGMKRKAALFKRLAGMQCVATNNPKPAWQKCYYLLLEALDGYKLTLDVKDRPKGYMYGWPLVQMRVLHELIYSARKMGNPAIAIRHLCYLLHTMFPHLQRAERQELAGVLESYTVRCESPANSLTLDNGMVLPPVTFVHFPLVKTLKFSRPAPHLQPVKLKVKDSLTESDTSSVNLFIYSPIQQRNKIKTKSEIVWVEGDTCDCVLQLYNPLPFELRIEHLNILTEGCRCEFSPQTLSLPAESGPYQVKISGRLKQPGRLIVTGYTSKVLGVWSNCLLSDLDEIPESEIVMRVTPPLPTLQLTTTLPKDASFSSLENSDSVVTSAGCSVYAGQRSEYSLLLSNSGTVPVEYISLFLEARHYYDLLKDIVVWNEDNLASQLPLKSGSQASLTVYINTTSDILSTSAMSYSTDSLMRSKHSMQDSDDVGSSKTLECLLKLEYSGGDGLKEEYCRQCAITMTIEIVPSVIIKSWSVLPSQSAEHCHLVLELENATSHTMEILNEGNSLLSIGSGQCKRCAVQLLRYDAATAIPATPGDANMSNHQTSTAREQQREGAATSCQQQLLIDHVVNTVDIRWRLPSEGKVGQLSLSRLLFTPDQMALLQISAFKWDITVRDSHGETACARYVCGEVYDVNWTLQNHSDEEYSDLCARLCIAQHHINCVHYTDVLGTQVVTVGMSSASLDKLPPGGAFSNQCSVVFLQAGVYKVKVMCEGRVLSRGEGRPAEDLITHQSPTLSVTVTEPSAAGVQADR